MTVEAKCKFCQRALSLQVDEEYAKLGDPYGMIGLAACNRCGDYRVARSNIFGAVRKRCLPLIGRNLKAEVESKHREIFALYVKRYMRLISDDQDQPMPDWDEGIIDALMKTPGNYADIFARIPRMFAAPTLL